MVRTPRARAGAAARQEGSAAPRTVTAAGAEERGRRGPDAGGAALARAVGWAQLPPDERHRRAVAAAAAHDGAALWQLTEAYLTLEGKSGARTSPHTRKSYRLGVHALVAAWKDQDLLHPARDAGTLWVRSLEAAGRTPPTVQARLAAARTLYGALRWAGATEADPFTGTKPARDTTPPWEKREPYSQEEVTALLAHAGTEERVLVLLGAHAGLRVSECLALRWSDVALSRRQLVVRRGKGGRQRTVPLSASLATALRALQAAAAAQTATEYVLAYRSDFPARQRMRALAERAGVPYRGIHALRHACGTRLVGESGGDLEAAARLLGHSSIETTRVYAKWNDQRLRTTLATW
jgi:integrase/recombinase XerC